MQETNTTQHLNAVDKLFIPHPQIKRAIALINQCIERSEDSTEPINILLTGNAGTGKTTACNAILKKYPRACGIRDHCEVSLVPAFYASISSPATVKGVASALLVKLGDIAPTRGTTSDLIHRIICLLRACETRIILLDEFQHLLLDRNNAMLIRNWIKSIINESNVLMVIIGTPDCKEIINVDDQLTRRFTYQVQLSYLEISLSEEKNDFLDFILCLKTGYMSKLNVEFFSEFLSPRTILALYVATGGNPADIMRLFKEAALCTLLAGRECILLDDFRIAFDQITIFNTIKPKAARRASAKNPFTRTEPELKTLILNRPSG